MRLAKLNHLSIITLFAIAFIVVYLYYTISDVKKIHSEVKRMSQDIEKLNQSITNITTSILPMLSFPTPTSSPQVPLVTKNQIVVATANNEGNEDSDDDVSVGTQELTKIMETIEDEDTKFDIDVDGDGDVVKVEEPKKVDVEKTTSIGTLSAEDLKKVPYNDIKKYCKKNNIDDKGSKEVLIYRIKNQPRSP